MELEPMTLKKYLLLWTFTLLLFAGITVLGQDETNTPAPTDEVSVTLEVSPAATDEPAVTQEVIIIVTQTPQLSPTPTLTPTDEPVVAPLPVEDNTPIIIEIPAAESNTPWSWLFNIALLIFIGVREFQHSGKVALSTVEKIIAIARRHAASTTETTVDDTAVDMAEAIALALLRRQNQPTPPAQPAG